MTAATITRRPMRPSYLSPGDNRADELLPARIRTASGQVVDSQLPAWRHRRVHLGFLHHATDGFFEIANGFRAPGGRTRWDSRRRTDSYWLGGQACGESWLDDALAHVSRLCSRPCREVAIGPAARSEASGAKAAVHGSRWLWLDVDEPRFLPRLHAFLLHSPAHLRVWSAGSGGEHAYWRLRTPQPAIEVDAETGEVIEWIERAHERLLEHVGRRVLIDGREVLRGGDTKCKDRNRVLRLPGTINYKTGAQARLISADFALAPYSLEQLVGHLPDKPTAARLAPRRRPAPRARTAMQWTGPPAEIDAYRAIPATEYALRMTGQEPDGSGLIRCPSPHHADKNPSCSVTGPNPTKWNCHGCDAHGTIFDFASAVLGGPTGAALVSDPRAFRDAISHVAQTFRTAT